MTGDLLTSVLTFIQKKILELLLLSISVHKGIKKVSNETLNLTFFNGLAVSS